jgi:Phage terminase-like protein, large subunit
MNEQYEPVVKMKYYNGNPALKAAGVTWEWEPWQLIEWNKCRKDPIYFFENYINIIALGKGKVLFKPYEFQKTIVKEMVDNRFVICKIPRQQGKTTTVAALLLWYVLFNEDFKIAVLAHKAEQSREILSRIQMAYEMLPHWLQQGVLIWNKGDIKLENGSIINAEATSSGSVRGRTYDIVYLDEFAHVEPNVQEDFYTSTYPVITSGEDTKMLITSTPKGMEYFYYIWDQAEKGLNEFVTVSANWWDVPGRDEAWKAKTIRNTSAEQFRQEFECEFLGSSMTLIDGRVLAAISTSIPLNTQAGEPPKANELWIYEAPVKNNKYVICVDTSRGQGIDYSAFVVLDVTKLPYRVSARYRDNTIPSLLYPNKIMDAAKHYNEAHVLIESNDVGAQVADIMLHDLEYEYLFMTQTKGRAGQQLGGDVGSASRQLGVKMSKGVKSQGCAGIKTIIETNNLVMNDFTIKQEFSTFVVKKQSFAADEGKHDDLVMCLVAFGWLINQDYFKELLDMDFRAELEDNNHNFIEQDMTPFGMIDDGSESFSSDGFFDYDDPDFGKW